jgi:hypothetical protein
MRMWRAPTVAARPRTNKLVKLSRCLGDRPALFGLIGAGGLFGMVERVTAGAVHIRASRAGRPAVVIPRAQLEMVYIPVGRLSAGVASSGFDH